MKRTALLFSLLIAAISVAPAYAATIEIGVHTLSFGIQESINLLGNAEFYIVDGGSTRGYVDVRINSSLTMLGGRIEDDLIAVSTGTVTIKGGTIGGDILLNPPTIQQANLYIYGSNFAIDGVPVGPGTYLQSGRYTGILENGDQLDNRIGQASGKGVVLVPEPATLGLLTLGVVMLRRKKRFFA